MFSSLGIMIKMNMTPKERFDQDTWEVLQKIEGENLITEKNKPVKYKFPNFQGVGILSKDRVVSILFKMQELGVLLVRDNPWEPPIPADDEIYLDLIQPKFEELYKKYEREQSNASFHNSDHKQDRPAQPSRRDLKKEISSHIKTLKLGKKERKFLKLLSKDFKPVTMEEISEQIPTKDCKHLKARISKKIKHTNFCIKTVKSGGWGKDSSYQLIYSPRSEN